jgi:pyruvate dehydrogenase E2 component (dihydrolipoamide acetyltransferase)
MNATLKEDGIHLLPQVHIGLATALETGLIVPVIRDADLKTVGQIATELNDLVRRARENQLTPDEVTGGTFTLSNLGMFGIETFTPILNPPETGILAVGAVVREPVVLEGDEVVVRPRVGLTLSADHRVVDGVSAAKFLSDVKAAIEDPDLLLL